MAWDLGREGIGAQGLSDRTGRAASDHPGQRGVGDDAPARDAFQRGINARGESGNAGKVFSFQCSVFAERWRRSRLALAILFEH